jgi:hypothetical protein
MTLPQQRQQALVGEDRLPRRLQPAHTRPGEVRSVPLTQHVLPGIELEAGLQLQVLGVHEAAVGVQADALHGHELGLQPRLNRHVLQVADRLPVLDHIGVAGEMDEAAVREDDAETVAQSLVHSVELVRPGGEGAGGELVLQPQPLEHRRLEHRSGRVGVVLVESGRARAVVEEVEPSVEGRLSRAPGGGDEIAVLGRDRQAVEQGVRADRVFDQIEAERVQRLGRRLEMLLHLGEREGVGGRLVPVGDPLRVTPDEAHGVGLRSPVGTGLKAQAAHAALPFPRGAGGA